jgi:hypothetical protein
MITAAVTYGTKTFLQFINDLYFPLHNMRTSSKRLQTLQSADDLQKLRWGEYQTVLVPLENWPDDTGKKWLKSVKLAREDLAKQANTRRLHRYSKNRPATKLDLLDAAVQLCFNTGVPTHGPDKPEVGIPMVIDVQAREADDPASALHDIQLSWTYSPNGAPIQLNLTMVCPFESAFVEKAAP